MVPVTAGMRVEHDAQVAAETPPHAFDLRLLLCSDAKLAAQLL